MKNLNIKSSVSFLQIPKYEQTDIFKEYPSPGYLDLKLPKGIIDVVIDPHSHERWNSRVGPITTKEIITNVFKMAILIQPNRVQVLEKELAILDDEFVFSFKFENAILTITTFFGRISLNPMLSNVDTLRRYNTHFKEEITLDIDVNILIQQELPYAPSSVTEFEDSDKKTHLLFYYKCKEANDFYYHLVREDNADDWDIKMIDLKHPNRFTLSETQLHLLGLLGHNYFLLKYMSQLDQDRFKNFIEIHSKTALRRFAGNKGWNYLRKQMR